MAKLELSWAAFRLNLVFFGGIIIWTVLFLPLGFLAWLRQITVKGVASHIAIRNLIQWYGARCALLLASQTRVVVTNRIGALPRPCIIVANHQSFFDPYCIGFFPVFAPTFMVRGWPFCIPIYGGIMRQAGYIDIENTDMKTFLQQAKDVIRDGATLVVFPEGTRSATGELGKFHSGAFKLAVECAVPVVPLCIDGACQVFPRGKRFGKPAPMSVTLLPPVYPEKFSIYGELAHRHLQKNIRFAMVKALQTAQFESK